MKMNTCVSGAPFIDRESIKSSVTARQRRVDLRAQLDALEESAQGDSDRAKELRAMIGLLDELIGGQCE